MARADTDSRYLLFTFSWFRSCLKNKALSPLPLLVLFFRHCATLTCKKCVVSVRLVFHHVLYVFGGGGVMDMYSGTSPRLWYRTLLCTIEIFTVIWKISTQAFQLGHSSYNVYWIDKHYAFLGFVSVWYFKELFQGLFSFRFGGKSSYREH